ncbi:MAG: hypothetical protein CMJ50_07845 [Planctomycetaceae bacterium]|nr:hypothetical protein [Planctomycetaceae bacterium]
MNHLLAVRSGKWKLVLPRSARPGDLGCYGRLQEAIAEPKLFDLEVCVPGFIPQSVPYLRVPGRPPKWRVE